ncbi:ATPase, T2SS/T4P/T4SS family [Pseudoalteromonas sp. BDTF-M6]|uniref:ATPase, T2SS/T4P/T4SS family n=1 Tax=Pseudoalteromonas sp. BDTF-M6 TaxID=2796132 RepID=UPI001BAF82F2|nr:ATPase, T2SS/T4P/T4SS family [Pseudoalteromonas sp. BDTF-M6]MBS3796824.1 Flp pilus assembly complex ATPase component TadA [Pseudoalteromonas sp. BDTF-M6]
MFEVKVNTAKGTKVGTIKCNETTCVIGKDKRHPVVLHGFKVSREHAKLYLRDDGIYLEDRASRTGTLVNGKSVESAGPLNGDDVIEIGGYHLSVVASESMKKTQQEQRQSAETNRGGVPAQAPAFEVPSVSDGATTQAPKAALAANDTEQKREEIKLRNTWRKQVHKELIKQIDLRRVNVSEMSDDELRTQSKGLIDAIIDKFDLPATISKESLSKEVLDETIGLGPLERLVADPDVSEIMVNSHDEIFFEKAGKLYLSDIAFTDDQAVLGAIERIVTPLGRRIDEGQPMVDARLKDGSRVNAIIPPLALKGPCITIRKFMSNKLEAEDLVRFGSLSPDMVRFLEMAVVNKRNVVISGGTGSGKTTLLNVLSNFIPDDERIITVEDAAELKLYQPNLVSLEARPPNQEGKGAIEIRDLVKNCLRMRPDRIVVGECRGGEALDMLQAMNTGHDGSLTTAHANTPRDCISRLEVMVMMAGMDLPIQAIREQIGSAVNMIVQQSRFSDGSRRVTSICEITGVESNTIQLSEIFKFKQTGYSESGKVLGDYVATGMIPEFYEKLREQGMDVDLGIFKVSGND